MPKSSAELVREARAKLIAFERVYGDASSGLVRAAGAALERAFRALEADPWIAVDYERPETFPPTLERVFLSNGSTTVMGFYDKGNACFWFYGASGLQKTFRGAMTHWMPLPQGPQAKGAGR